jgi:hypothetical protein
MTSTEWSQVPALVEGLREPVILKRELVRRIQEAYAALAGERGAVHVPEDTFAMQRRLGTTRDQFTGYMAAFRDAVGLLKQLMEEELVEAVGEQDGIPNQGLTVPDAEGDIRLSLDTPRVYSIDLDQVRTTILENVLRNVDLMDVADGTAPTTRQLYDLVEVSVEEATTRLLSLGKFELQVSKVKAYAATLARAGLDKQSSVVSGAISETHPYKGVKFERKTP